MSDDSERDVPIHLSPGRGRAWWLRRGGFRYFRFEVVTVLAYTVYSLTMVIIGVMPWYSLAPVVAITFMLLASMYRAANTYHLGFQCALAAFPLAMAQPTAAEAVDLIERTDELWDPSPLEVAHTLEVERLEIHVNKGDTDGRSAT